jgi:hypothetical protein
MIDYRNDLAANHVDDWEDTLEVAVALMADNCQGSLTQVVLQ